MNLAGLEAANVSPTAMTEGRSNKSALDLSGLTTIARGVGGLAKKLTESNNDAAVAGVVDASLAETQALAEQRLAGFNKSPSDNMVDNMVSEMEGRGETVDPQARAAFKAAADAGARLHTLEQEDPDRNKLRADLNRTKLLRQMIAADPRYASEIRSLLFSDNNFLSRIATPVAPEAPGETIAQKTEREARQKRIEATAQLYVDNDPTLATLPTEEIIRRGQATPLPALIKMAGDAEARRKALEGQKQLGQLVSDADVQDIVAHERTGVAVVLNSRLKQIESQVGLTPDQRKSQMVAVGEEFILAAMQKTNKPRAWVEAEYGIKSFTDSSISALDVGNLEASQSVNARKIVENAAFQQFNVEYPGALRLSQAVELMKHLPAYQQDKAFQAYVKDNGGTFWKSAAESDGNSYGNRPSKLDAQGLQREADSFQGAANAAFSHWDKTPAEGRETTMRWINREINHRDNDRSLAKLDAVVTTLANPQVRKMVGDPAFKKYITATEVKALERVPARIVEDATKFLSSKAGKLSFADTKEGIRVLVATDRADNAQVDRLNKRIGDYIMATAHLRGTDYQQASVAFWQEWGQ